MARRSARGRARRPRRTDALGSPRAFALQRELARARLPSAALEDTAYLDWYVSEVLAARAEFEAALDAAGVRCWPSRANFVLVDIGAQHAEFVRRCARRECWCATARTIRAATGCVRITIGTREQMQHAMWRLMRHWRHWEEGKRNDRRTSKVRVLQTQGTTQRCDRAQYHGNAHRHQAHHRRQGQYKVSTGIRFFDHMLELFTRHGAFDLELKCDGDLDVDQHHTVEDVGIALGEAFDRASATSAASCAPATSSCRWTRRSRSPRSISAAGRIRGRHQGAHARWSATCKPSWSRISSRLRARRPRQRAREDDVRPLEPSQDRGHLQGVRARAARRLLARQALGEMLPCTKGLL